MVQPSLLSGSLFAATGSYKLQLPQSLFLHATHPQPTEERRQSKLNNPLACCRCCWCCPPSCWCCSMMFLSLLLVVDLWLLVVDVSVAVIVVDVSVVVIGCWCCRSCWLFSVPVLLVIAVLAVCCLCRCCRRCYWLLSAFSCCTAALHNKEK